MHKAVRPNWLIRNRSLIITSIFWLVVWYFLIALNEEKPFLIDIFELKMFAANFAALGSIVGVFGIIALTIGTLAAALHADYIRPKRTRFVRSQSEQK